MLVFPAVAQVWTNWTLDVQTHRLKTHGQGKGGLHTNRYNEGEMAESETESE